MVSRLFEKQKTVATKLLLNLLALSLSLRSSEQRIPIGSHLPLRRFVYTANQLCLQNQYGKVAQRWSYTVVLKAKADHFPNHTRALTRDRIYSGSLVCPLFFQSHKISCKYLCSNIAPRSVLFALRNLSLGGFLPS